MTAPVNPFASHVNPDEAPLYLMTYDHAVGYPHIQEEARKTIAMVEANPEFRTGSQVEGWTWDWLAKNDPGFVNEARGWIARQRNLAVQLLPALPRQERVTRRSTTHSTTQWLRAWSSLPSR